MGGVLLFLSMTFSIDWLIALLFKLSGGRWNTPPAVFLGVVYMFIPAICSVIVQRMIYKESILKPLGISFKLNHWFLGSWVIPPLLALGAIGVGVVMPEVEYSSDISGFLERLRLFLSPEEISRIEGEMSRMPVNPILIALIQGLIAGPTLNAAVAFGEELGWRGFLQVRFSNMGFWKGSSLIGLIWGIWHAPLILQGHNYPQHPTWGVGMMVLFCVLLAPILSYLRLKARSVIASSIAHGTLNGTGGIAILVLKGGNDLTVGLTGASGLIVLLVANLLLLIYDRLIAFEKAEDLIKELQFHKIS